MSHDLTIDHIMQTGLLTCRPDTPLCEAAVRMARRRCSAMLVMEEGRPSGIWTEHDSLRVNFADPEALRVPIGQVMSHPVACLPPATSISEAAARFNTEGYRHFLVADDAKTPLGIISQTDVIMHQGLEPYLRLRKVSSAMRRQPLVLTGELALSEATAHMRRHDCDAVVVRCDSDTLGILTERDLVGFVACHPGVTAIGQLASRPLLTVQTDEVLVHARDLLINHRVRHLAVLDETGQVVGLLGFKDILASTEQRYLQKLRDVLEQRDQALVQSRQHMALAERVIESSMEGIIITDADKRIEFVNPAFTHMTGYSLEEVVGRTPAVLSSGRHDATFYEQMWDTLRQYGYWRGEIWNRRKSGQLYLELLTITAIRSDAGKITHYAALFSDITHLRENEEKIRRLAYYDALTHLPNRRLLEDRLSLAVRHAHRQDHRLAVVFIDLDHFKQINDTYGHEAGDELLLRVSRRIEQNLREDDTLARLGGDEFVALLPDLKGPEGATRVTRRLIEALASPFQIGTHQFRVGCSLGVSFYPDDATTVKDLLRNADAAMYRAKQEGRNTYRLYRSDMHFQDHRQVAMETALHDTAETGQGLRVHFQPLFDRDSGELRGAEALLRWHHHEFGVVSPADFIPLAERSGLILPLGERLMQCVASQLQAWQQTGLNPVPVAINLSSRQFWQHDLAEQVRRLFETYNLSPGLIGFDLTESTLLSKQQQATGILQKLRDQGCFISIDDFGTGHSSLSHLPELPVNALKIDRPFIQHVGESRSSNAMLAAVTGLARELDLKVVAEGVETKAQMTALNRYSIQLVQGYFTGRPVGANRFAEAYLKTAC